MVKYISALYIIFLSLSSYAKESDYTLTISLGSRYSVQSKDQNPETESSDLSYGVFFGKDYYTKKKNDFRGIHWNLGFQKLKAYNNIDLYKIKINSTEFNIGFSCDLLGFIIVRLSVGNAYLTFDKKINNDLGSKYSFYLEPAIGFYFSKVSFILSYKDYALNSFDLNGYNASITYNF